MSTAINPALRGRFEKIGNFFKVENGVAYGWAIVCTENGMPYWDLQDDHIPEDEMVVAATEFMKSSRVGSDQHTGDHTGDIVFAFPVLAGAEKTLGIKSQKTGLLIGYQPQSKEQLDLIASGDRTGFSIGGYLLDWEPGEVGKKLGKTAGGVRARLLKGAIAKDGSPDASDVYTPEDVADKKKKPKKGKVYRRFKIDEISTVTKPAQEGAVVGFVKGAVIAKADYDVVFTSSDDGHQHIVDVDDYDEDGRGCTSYAITADGECHSHVWLRKDDGAIELGDNAGHGHSVDATSPEKPAEEDAGSGEDSTITSVAGGGDFLVMQLAAPPAQPRENSTASSKRGSVASKSQEHQEQPMTPEQIEALNKRLQRAEKMSELSDAQRAYAKSLGEQGVETYLAKSPGERIELAKGAIEYTAADGTVYYKHDDHRMVAMAKTADKANADLLLEKQLRRTAEFAKAAAEDMSHLEGDAKVHAAVIGAIESIADEPTRTAARATLKAADAAVAKLARPTGSTGAVSKTGQAGPTPYEKASADMKTAIEKYQTDHKLGTYAEAFAEATGSDPKVRELYNELAELRESN